MPGRVQIQVLKQGLYNENDWSTRTLTLDPASGTAIVSRHNHPDDILHHAMHVMAIQKASDAPPHHHHQHQHDGKEQQHHEPSEEAKMTLHLIGKKVPVPELKAEKKPEDKAEGEDGATPYSNSSSPAERVNPSEEVKPANSAEEDVDESWMIRCTSQESYDTAVRVLEELVNAHHQHDHHALKDPNPHLPAMPPPVVGVTMHNLTQGPVL